MPNAAGALPRQPECVGSLDPMHPPETFGRTTQWSSQRHCQARMCPIPGNLDLAPLWAQRRYCCSGTMQLVAVAILKCLGDRYLMVISWQNLEEAVADDVKEAVLLSTWPGCGTVCVVPGGLALKYQ